MKTLLRRSSFALLASVASASLGGCSSAGDEGSRGAPSVASESIPAPDAEGTNDRRTCVQQDAPAAACSASAPAYPRMHAMMLE